MLQIPEDSFFGRFGFRGDDDDEADLKAALQRQWTNTSVIIEQLGSVISASCRLQMQQTGCTYEEAATAFLQKCDEYLTVNFVLSEHHAHLKSEKKESK